MILTIVAAALALAGCFFFGVRLYIFVQPGGGEPANLMIATIALIWTAAWACVASFARGTK